MLTIVGRVTDIFGRRWVFVGGSFLAVIGSIVCATAQSVKALIGGTTIIGVAASTQLSYFYIMGELVPMKFRLAGNAYAYLWQFPGSGLAPAIAHAFLLYTNVGWRGLYYLLIAVNAVSFLCWFFFYHPPTFKMKHQGASKMKYLKSFDYFGTALYTGGLLILLMGLNWGGAVYEWKSAHVIGTIVVGAVALIVFSLWEGFMSLEEPLVPLYLFQNRGWNASTILSSVAASMYYAFAIVWPAMVTLMYSDGGPMVGPWLSTFVGLFIVLGEIVAGFCAKYIGHLKCQCVVMTALGGIFFACVATCGPDTKLLACVLVSLGVFFLGWVESVSITLITLTTTDQTNLGTACGISGSIRFLISSISSTVYNVILSNRLAQTIPAQVPPAVVNAGLPTSSVEKFIAGFTTGTFENITGLTPEIQAIGTRAFKEANAAAYRTVFLSTLAFTGVAVIAGLLLPKGLDELLTGKVSTTLYSGRHKKRVAGE